MDVEFFFAFVGGKVRGGYEVVKTVRGGGVRWMVGGSGVGWIIENGKQFITPVAS